MDAIHSYIDHMFRSLPRTEEVKKAQRELQQMCEDRYQELRADGVTEHEAVGRVITQFGNLDEIADELGIRQEVDGRPDTEDQLEVSREEAESFLRVRRTGARLIAAGVFIILLGVSSMIWLGATEMDGGAMNPLALILFFLCVAIAVAMFIVSGMSMGRFDRYEHRQLSLDSGTMAKYQALREAEHGRFTASIVIGVMIIILAFGAGAVTGFLNDTGTDQWGWVAAIMPLAIGIGVGVLVIGAMRRGALDRLLSEGDYSPDKQRENELISRIAGPYWILALVIFLAWSFIGDAWERSWIIWPIAGVLFALVAVTVNAIQGEGSKPRR